MNLYLLRRKGRVSYDEFDALVVCASTEEDAKQIHPSYGWVSPDRLDIELIGIASENMKAGLVLGSFNAG